MLSKDGRGGGRVGTGSAPNLTKTARQLAAQVAWLHAKPTALGQVELAFHVARLRVIVADLARLLEGDDPLDAAITTLGVQLQRASVAGKGTYQERQEVFRRIDELQERAETWLCEAPDYPSDDERRPVRQQPA
jgi:hypothetical protein